MKNLVKFLEESAAVQDAAAGDGKMTNGHSFPWHGRNTRRELKTESNRSRRQSLKDRHINEVTRQYGSPGHSSFWD